MQIVESYASYGVEVEEVSDRILEAVSDTQTPQGLIAVFPIPCVEPPTHSDFILILDELRDPGNLGSILRSATAAGVQACILTPGTADVFAPKVIRAAMGAHFHIPLFNWSWDQISPFCEQWGLKIFLADAIGGLSYWKVDLRQPVGLVIGGEAEGAGTRARQVAHSVLTIPMPGSSESLNAAVAAGILLFEVVRQRI
jgi:TrmH family RNA methyltransferase